MGVEAIGLIPAISQRYRRRTTKGAEVKTERGYTNCTKFCDVMNDGTKVMQRGIFVRRGKKVGKLAAFHTGAAKYLIL